MSRDYRAKRPAKDEDIPYAEALRRLRAASAVDWPTHEVTEHVRLEVAGYAGDPDSEDAA